MTTLTVERPEAAEYAPYQAAYVALVPEGDVIAALERARGDTAALLRSIDEERSKHRYAPGKWSIRELVGHVVDAERVFTYRALRFARGDGIPLPGFDENAWAAASNAHQRSLAEHTREYEEVRAATVALFRGFTAEQFARGGVASDHLVTVRALAYIVAGHERHHVKILRERYLTS